VHVSRDMGYQVIRDNLASRFTPTIAERKANAVILSGMDSSTFRNNRPDIHDEMNQVDGILMLEGGLPIHADTRCQWCAGWGQECGLCDQGPGQVRRTPGICRPIAAKPDSQQGPYKTTVNACWRALGFFINSLFVHMKNT
jgi:hypothetical protein